MNTNASPPKMAHLGEKCLTNNATTVEIAMAMTPLGRKRTEVRTGDQWYTSCIRGICKKNTDIGDATELSSVPERPRWFQHSREHHQKNGMKPMANKIGTFLNRHTRGGKAAVSGSMKASNVKNAATITIEMTSGARTFADPHPETDPDVTAYTNKIRAAVTIDTPSRSRCFQLGLWRRGADGGTTRSETNDTVSPMMPVAQRIQRHVVH
jgi:hypothetical protein